MSHPPKPQLTLRIGVTGHRPGMQLPTESFARVRSQVQDVLKNASGVLAKAHQQFQAKYSSASTQVRIISSLAEGADRIVAEVALAFGFGLEVILPFDRAAYEADFSGEESRREFGELLKHASAIFEIEDEKALIARDHAYVAAGEELLAQCDLLLAIWDGAAGRGKGGTAEVLS